ncbi:MAG: DUF4827 family protein [Parabacteroides sp.]
MRKGFAIVLMCCAVLLAASCSKTKSYTDYLNEEKDAIERLIDEKGFEVLKDFPADSVFKENQFVKLETGVYLNIIDKGTDERAVSGTKVIYRCIVSYPKDSAYIYQYSPYATYARSDGRSINYGPNSNGTDPYSMSYGDYYYGTNIYSSEGIQQALEYVGDRALVKLIVPFKRGLPADQSSYEPAYYEILQYKFEDNL